MTASHHDDGTGTDRWMFQGHDYPTRKAMCEARRAEYVRLLAEEGMNLDWLQCIRQSDEGRMTWNWRPTMADPKHPRHYDEAFKRQIVQLYENGKPAREVKDEYDVSHSTLHRWVQGIRNSGSTKAADNRTPEQNELIELRKRNRQLEMEVDVLTQAALIFARK